MVEVVDGGDRACGELLLLLAARARRLSAGVEVRLIATDPAAAIDLPAWCYLTGHEFLAAATMPDGRACYDVLLTERAQATQPNQPWRLQPPVASQHQRPNAIAAR